MDEARLRDAERRMWDAVGVLPTERRLDLQQTGVQVRVQEVGDGPPILFVHGASNSGTSWATLVPCLPQFRCILLDRPGCGLSQAAATARDVDAIRSLGETLIADVLDALELDRADVVATSYGGFFGLHAAARHPQRLAHLVLLGWSLGVPSAPFPLFMRLSGIPGVGRLGAAMPVSERSVRWMFRRIGLRDAMDAGAVSRELVSTYTALLRHTDTMRNEIASHLVRMDGIDKRLLFTDDDLAGISVPTYLLWGEHDPFGDPTIARTFARRMPGARLELMPGAGHAVWIDDPVHTAAVITSFFDA